MAASAPRVDLQGWGERVCSTGYGDYELVGGDSNQAYTADFAGTSSASPLVAGAAVGAGCYAATHRPARVHHRYGRQVIIVTSGPSHRTVRAATKPSHRTAHAAIEPSHRTAHAAIEPSHHTARVPALAGSTAAPT